MMNVITPEKRDLAERLALQGCSIRIIAREAGIAKQTAQTIKNSIRDTSAPLKLMAEAATQAQQILPMLKAERDLLDHRISALRAVIRAWEIIQKYDDGNQNANGPGGQSEAAEAREN